MEFQIVQAFPPNIADLAEVFPKAMSYGVVFAHVKSIYNPSGLKLGPEIVAHECVHLERQQKLGVANWYAHYLTDKEFRYHEEMLAHRAEYQKLCELSPNRHGKRGALKHVAKKLSSQLYMGMVSFERAKRDLEAA